MLGRIRERVAGRGNGAVVLLYHRVAALAEDPQRLAVAPQRFRAQMELLHAEYRPLPLIELIRLAGRNKIPDRAVAVTFDDGYADNLHEAEPVLTACDVPATVFVATGYTGGSREFWWDELERLLLLGGERPPSLELELGAGRRSWRTSTPADREAAYVELIALLRNTVTGIREAALEALRRWAGEPENGLCRPTHRAMSVEELRALAASDQVEVAPHTRHHPCLAREELDVQRHEVAESAADLAEWLGYRSSVFSYPFGNPGADYTDESVEVVRELAFEAAVSTIPRPLTSSSPALEVPRQIAPDAEPAEFERWLAGAFAA